MIDHKKIPSLCVRDLLALGNGGDNSIYTIPVYQRNYAWGSVEIKQLLDDIHNAFKKSSEAPYYLGSLVVYRKGNAFEVIDGQQRLTTLHILAAALGCQVKDNLHFQHRKESIQALQAIRSRNSHSSLMAGTIIEGFNIAKNWISQNISNNATEFREFFENRVEILRVEVPPETDLMRYFEIMNSRGEQLEKHEILKARLMGRLCEADRPAFAAIWDACSDMNREACMGFKKEIRDKIFGEDTQYVPTGFDDIANKISKDANLIDGKSIKDIISSLNSVTSEGSSPEQTERSRNEFTPIIDFPNFLLHALKIYANKNEKELEAKINLDDLLLLESFNNFFAKSGNGIAANQIKLFACTLLKCRLLFDRHIICSDDNGRWKIRSLIQDAESDEQDAVSSRASLVMVQSMLQVSFSSRTYKNWLFEALHYLFGKGVAVDEKDFCLHLEGYATDYAKKTYGNLDDDGENFILNRGTGVPHFIFNWLDYIIYKTYHNNRDDARWKCIFEVCHPGDLKYLEDWFNGFHFTYRGSVEHHAPQNPYGDDAVINVNHFGNLYLTSRSENSSLSNHSAEDKRKSYLNDKKTIKSLKQALMLSHEKWDSGSIKSHGDAMLALLRKEIA